MTTEAFVKGMKKFGTYKGSPKQGADKVSTRTTRTKVALRKKGTDTYYKYSIKSKKYSPAKTVRFDMDQVTFKKSGGSKFKGTTDLEGARKFLQ